MTEEEKLLYFESDEYKQNQSLVYGTSSLESFHRQEDNIAKGNTLLKDTVLSFFNLEDEEQDDFFTIIDYYKDNEEVPKEDRLETMMKMLETINEENKKRDKQLRKDLLISSKILLNVKEVELMFGLTERKQETLRNPAQKDPIPYIQTKEGGNLQYDRKDIEKWYENYKKNMR